MANTETKRKDTVELNSELPIGGLLDLSKSLSPHFFERYYITLRNQNVLLTPRQHGAGFSGQFLDISGIRGLLAEHTDDRVRFGAPIGTLANREWQLRERWRRHEYHLRVNGAMDPTALPTDRMAEDIAALAVNLKIVMEEVAKMRKVLKEHDAKEAERVKATRKKVGSCKRGGPPDYRIMQVDGMAVDEDGIITEIGQQVEEYLAEIKAERERQMLYSKWNRVAAGEEVAL